MAIGRGLQHLLASPMAGGQQQQFPDPTDMVSQVMRQFSDWLRKRQQSGGQLALGGRQGIQAPVAQQPIQAPVGTPPRERAGRMRSAGMEGIDTMMGQAGEAAAEPWKPQALDIGLMAATIALPIIAAMQPEGRGRRGQRRQQRRSELFKTLGGFAGQGLGMRMESFGAGKEATLGAAEKRAELAGEEVTAKYEHEIGRIKAETEADRWERQFGLAERGMAVRERPKLGKEPFTPTQLYRQGRDIASDTRKQALIEANQIIQALERKGIWNPEEEIYEKGQRFTIKSRQDLDAMIFELEQGDILHMTRGLPGRQTLPRTNVVAPILARLKELRDQYDTGAMGGGQTGKPADMTDTEWQEYLQMIGR